jgi:hypothetical protein
MPPRLTVTDRVAAADLERIEEGLAASDPPVGPYVRARRSRCCCTTRNVMARKRWSAG